MNHAQAHKRTKLAALLAAALALAACGQRDDGLTVGQNVDQTVAQAERKADEAKAATESTAERAARKVENATESVVVADAAVTAGINAELAKDPALSALKIDVDTQQGRVRLSGSAPSADARDRATRLAAAVKGVQSVDNALKVGG